MVGTSSAGRLRSRLFENGVFSSLVNKTAVWAVKALGFGNYIDQLKWRFGQEYLLKNKLHKDVYIGMAVLHVATPNLADFNDGVIRFMKAYNNNVDPYAYASTSLKEINNDLLQSISIVYTDVSKVSEYLFTKPGKRFRPTLSILFNNFLSDTFKQENSEQSRVLQNKMIEVGELIHTASMLHDDVIDEADTRRGHPTAHKKFGNKKAILGGDFLLARACRISAGFGCPEILERVANIVESLVKGELLQICKTQGSLDTMFQTYLTKSYYKTASLMAESCASGAVLGGYDAETVGIAYEFGTAVGMSFQLYDDLLDFTSTSKTMGKPILNDINHNIVTAPAYLALLEHSGVLTPLLFKKEKTPEDIETIHNHVSRSDAIERTRLAVLLYAARALQLLQLICQKHTQGVAIGDNGIENCRIDSVSTDAPETLQKVVDTGGNNLINTNMAIDMEEITNAAKQILVNCGIDGSEGNSTAIDWKNVFPNIARENNKSKVGDEIRAASDKQRSDAVYAGNSFGANAGVYVRNWDDTAVAGSLSCQNHVTSDAARALAGLLLKILTRPGG